MVLKMGLVESLGLDNPVYLIIAIPWRLRIEHLVLDHLVN